VPLRSRCDGFCFRRLTVNRGEILRKLAMFQGEMKDFSVKDLYLFGSCAREEAGEQSDVDLLVEFDPEAEIGLFEFARLRRRLSELLGVEVDLVTRDAIHPEMKSEILGEAIHAS
jgi:uncharacterized protein